MESYRNKKAYAISVSDFAVTAVFAGIVGGLLVAAPSLIEYFLGGQFSNVWRYFFVGFSIGFNLVLATVVTAASKSSFATLFVWAMANVFCIFYLFG